MSVCLFEFSSSYFVLSFVICFYYEVSSNFIHGPFLENELRLNSVFFFFFFFYLVESHLFIYLFMSVTWPGQGSDPRPARSNVFFFILMFVGKDLLPVRQRHNSSWNHIVFIIGIDGFLFDVKTNYFTCFWLDSIHIIKWSTYRRANN